MFKRGELIEFEWVDPATYLGHQDRPEDLICVLAKTSGYFINQDDKYIRVCHTDYGTLGVTDVTVVHLALIVGKPRRVGGKR